MNSQNPMIQNADHSIQTELNKIYIKHSFFCGNDCGVSFIMAKENETKLIGAN
jgi:hypothetical protein